MILTKRHMEEIRALIVEGSLDLDSDKAITDALYTIEAQAQTIAELTAKLDAVRGLDAEWKRRTELGFRPTGSQCMADLLAILDAPTKPKEARNE